jgi:hypothetical protein
VGASTKAIIYTAKNDREQALRSLEDAQKQEDWFMLWLKVTPEFDPLRDDVRFQKLVERAGLPSGIQ